MRTARRTALFCLVAIINILTTLLPVWPMRYRILAHGLPNQLIFASQHLTLLLGVTMLLLAYPAAQGHRRAAQILMACAGAAVLANLFKGLDVEEALLNAVALIVLWRGRRQLHDISVRYTVIDLARLGLALIALTLAYNLAGRAVIAGLRLLMERSEDTLPWVLVHLLTAKLPLQVRLYHESELLLPLFLLTVFLLFSWTSLVQASGNYQGDDDLYERFGRASHNSLAYLARRSDVRTFMEPAGRGVITYRQVGRIALQIGAILAPPRDREAVYRAFCAYCKSARLIPAAVALSEEELPIARANGMKTITIGTEAVVDLADFAVEKLAKKMRWVQRSLTKRGYSCVLLPANQITAQLRVALDAIDDEWRVARGGQTHGCCMTLGRFPTHADPDCLIGIVYAADQQPVAYLTLLPGGEGYYSLDLTRRRFDAPNAAMEFLLIEVLSQLKVRNATTVSLNFSTFSSLTSTRAGNAAMKLAGRAVQLGSLEAFNAKFRPNWVPRYVALPAWFYLPDVTYAILAAEGVDRMAINAGMRWLHRYLRPETRPRFEPRVQGEGAVN